MFWIYKTDWVLLFRKQFTTNWFPWFSIFSLSLSSGGTCWDLEIWWGIRLFSFLYIVWYKLVQNSLLSTHVRRSHVCFHDITIKNRKLYVWFLTVFISLFICVLRVSHRSAFSGAGRPLHSFRTSTVNVTLLTLLCLSFFVDGVKCFRVSDLIFTLPNSSPFSFDLLIQPLSDFYGI